jgi:hypothetical protein
MGYEMCNYLIRFALQNREIITYFSNLQHVIEISEPVTLMWLLVKNPWFVSSLGSPQKFNIIFLRVILLRGLSKVASISLHVYHSFTDSTNNHKRTL